MIWLLCAVAQASDIQQFSPSLAAQARHYQTELKIAGMPSIYNLRFHLHAYKYTAARAAFGAMAYEDHDTNNTLSVEMRVGSSAFDNTNFGIFDTGYSRLSLPLELTDFAVDHAAWLATDRAYKAGVEQFTRKRAQHSYPDNHPGDYQTMDATHVTGQMPQAIDPQGLIQTIRAMSSHLSAPGSLEIGTVYLGVESGGETIVDTEGSVLFRPLEETSLQAVAHARAVDGALITDTRIWTGKRPEHLPNETEMTAEVVNMAFDLHMTALSAPLEEEIVGPVILEGSAARDLFRYLLIPQLEGTPAPLPFDSSFGALGGSMSTAARINRRILPPAFSVLDDPQRDVSHPSATTLDAEGTPTEMVQLVEGGLVKSLLMSRIPRTDLAKTNGHARGYAGERLLGRASQLIVSAQKAVRRKKLYRAGIKSARAYGNDFVIIVRQLQEPSVLALGNNYTGQFFGLNEQTIAQLPPPVAIYKRTKDGQEVRLRGAQFAQVHRSILRQITMAGPSSSGSFFASTDPDVNTNRPLTGLATAVTAPDVLISEMEITPVTVNPRDIRTLRPSK